MKKEDEKYELKKLKNGWHEATLPEFFRPFFEKISKPLKKIGIYVKRK